MSKRSELIIADRYWLGGPFLFLAGSPELAILVVSCLSQVIGIEHKKKKKKAHHTDGKKKMYRLKFVCGRKSPKRGDRWGEESKLERCDRYSLGLVQADVRF